jgi:oligopeptide transport system substrate-binding protein
LRWSDGETLTAHDVEYGIKRVLDPERPGSSASIYFVLENGQDYYLGREPDPNTIGVRAVDERTVEFRLVAPAPYFMSVMNRPDSGPQPRHAIEAHGEDWTDPKIQVVSGPFKQAEQSEDHLVLERQDGYGGARPGNVARVEFIQTPMRGAVESYGRDELDVVAVRYTPRLADVVPSVDSDTKLGAAAWTLYLAFDHGHSLTSNVDFRRALALAIDRDELGAVTPSNLIVATGGLVPPALQGHTPDIALRFDPEGAREHLARSGADGKLSLAALDEFTPLVSQLAEMWRAVLELEVEVDWWTWQEATKHPGLSELVPAVLAGWLPGYADPEYYLRLLLHSDSKTNEGGFSYPPFDDLIERARQERSDRARLELFHEADRMAVADRVALIPLLYGRSMAFVKPWVTGWWEFGKSSASFADLRVERS